MNYRKLIEDFVITGVDETDGTITVFGEDESLFCKVYLDDVMDAHPGANGYGADMDCDRATWYHVEPEDLWKDGSFKGDATNMVCEVFDYIPKRWFDENDEEIIYPPNHYEMRWISVKDRIPTKDDSYILRTKYTYKKGVSSYREFYGESVGYLSSFSDSFSSDEIESTGVTHWMPMPGFKN